VREGGSRDSFMAKFNEIDADGSRKISWSEFLKHFGDEHTVRRHRLILAQRLLNGCDAAPLIVTLLPCSGDAAGKPNRRRARQPAATIIQEICNPRDDLEQARSTRGEALSGNDTATCHSRPPSQPMPTARTDTWHRRALFLQVIHAALARASPADVADDDKVHASTAACALLSGCLCLLNGCLC